MSGPAGTTGERGRAVVLGAAALALLLVGAAIGILLSLGGTSDAARQAPRPTEVDIGFAQDMAVHHLQAVQMANWERDHTNDPQLRQLAFDIEQTQLEQVGRMKGWLSMWGQPEQRASADRMSWMAAGHGSHGMSGMAGGRPMLGPGGLMPGMASDAELAGLRSMSGKQLDVRFLQLMLRHHQGGIPMARYAQQHGTSGSVRALARSMVVSQDNEVTLMRQLLADRGAAPLPAPH